MNTVFIPKNALTFAEAEDIFRSMMTLVDERNEDMGEVLDNLYRKAARYAGIRTNWTFLTREEKLDTDENRTSAHDSFITAIKMLSRIQGKDSLVWTDKLDLTDRKRIGDFACYLAMSLGIRER